MSEKKQSVGGAWQKTAKSGKVFFSITIGDKKYSMFRNEYKEPGSKQPDYRLFVDDWKPDGSNVKVPDNPHSATHIVTDLPF